MLGKFWWWDTMYRYMYIVPRRNHIQWQKFIIDSDWGPTVILALGILFFKNFLILKDILTQIQSTMIRNQPLYESHKSNAAFDIIPFYYKTSSLNFQANLAYLHVHVVLKFRGVLRCTCTFIWWHLFKLIT